MVKIWADILTESNYPAGKNTRDSGSKSTKNRNICQGKDRNYFRIQILDFRMQYGMTIYE